MTDTFTSLINYKMKLHKFQKEALESENRWTYIYQKRRSGVSTALALVGLREVLSGSTKPVLAICHSHLLKDHLFNATKSIVESFSWLKDMLSCYECRNDLIEFRNGGSIRFTAPYSGGLSGICGCTPNVLLLDAADHLKDEEWRAILPIMQGDSITNRHPRVYLGATYEGSFQFFRGLTCHGPEYRHIID